MSLLQIVVASTRPGRVGRPVGEWFQQLAAQEGTFDTELLDLAEIGLPFFDEPKHPRLGDYAHDHTRRWSETVGRGDAYAFVMPEYNFGYTAPLKNAVDFLWREWNDKPVILVGYGGVSGGLRAIQALKPVLTSVRLQFAAEVPIPFVHERMTDDGFAPVDATVDGALGALRAAGRLHEALATLRSRA